MLGVSEEVVFGKAHEINEEKWVHLFDVYLIKIQLMFISTIMTWIGIFYYKLVNKSNKYLDFQKLNLLSARIFYCGLGPSFFLQFIKLF